MNAKKIQHSESNKKPTVLATRIAKKKKKKKLSRKLRWLRFQETSGSGRKDI